MVPLLLARAALWGALATQDSMRPPAHAFALGAGAELWIAGEAALPILTLKAGWYRAGRIGVELGLGGLPQPFLIPEAGLTYQVRAGAAWIVVRGGLSPLVSPYGGVLAGYGGLGVILPFPEAGIRLDLSRRAVPGVEGVWSMGIAITRVPDG